MICIFSVFSRSSGCRVSVSAERCGLVQGGSWNSNGEEVQQCPFWGYLEYFHIRYDTYQLIYGLFEKGTAHIIFQSPYEITKLLKSFISMQKNKPTDLTQRLIIDIQNNKISDINVKIYMK